MPEPKFIAIDFDGTCVTHEYPDVGRDIGAVPVLKELVAAGHKLILFTMRSGDRSGGTDPLADAVDWFKQHRIPLFGINVNPSQGEWTKSPKVYAHLYIDDAALGAPLLPGQFNHSTEAIERPYIDWVNVRRQLFNKGLL